MDAADSSSPAGARVPSIPPPASHIPLAALSIILPLLTWALAIFRPRRPPRTSSPRSPPRALRHARTAPRRAPGGSLARRADARAGRPVDVRGAARAPHGARGMPVCCIRVDGDR
ncbi:hypothetical protein FA95DRAFT_1560418 [Auriscalpium vulgare]|uniref:Uncharacterized protein n=1 Tax=Auriscalpium vulgare TaxID=40419 RepID=A0ACB8RRE7_9AGAM|nr:hypothetical protein FA95DRAFT_1560418 [Auriscalpium vulgare]